MSAGCCPLVTVGWLSCKFCTHYSAQHKKLLMNLPACATGGVHKFTYLPVRRHDDQGARWVRQRSCQVAQVLHHPPVPRVAKQRHWTYVIQITLKSTDRRCVLRHQLKLLLVQELGK